MAKILAISSAAAAGYLLELTPLLDQLIRVVFSGYNILPAGPGPFLASNLNSIFSHIITSVHNGVENALVLRHLDGTSAAYALNKLSDIATFRAPLPYNLLELKGYFLIHFFDTYVGFLEIYNHNVSANAEVGGNLVNVRRLIIYMPAE